ncbi:TPA: acyl-CoA dehydrogenase [candidate division WOR-3 bacterium]|uniref:Acyl-CoA dehydrogenase n=1 Tax=candidate division WOR-3 bacterium TaxID=2052148 RepID=A0A350HC84_UNCW3|nr:acyl-CoA dehydrogenase [candidate division WOR-3 bacterium]
MHLLLSEELIEVKNLSRQIAEEKIKPVREELDEKKEFPYEIMKHIAKSDLFRVFIPEEYDGMGLGIAGMSIATEEFSRVCAGVALGYAGTGLGTMPIILFGSEEQKKKYLPQIASGEKLAAFGLTEANAGSDASNIQTMAKKDGDYYYLTGTKQFITNGEVAGIYTVIANTDPSKGIRGLSAFIVEKGTEGFAFGKHENKMGIRASATSELVFDNCRVHKSDMLAAEGQGFKVAMKTLEYSRLGVGAQALGIAQGAFEEAVKYANERVQFNQKIFSFQMIQSMIADMAIQIEAGRSLAYIGMIYVDKGGADVAKIGSMIKTFCSDMAMKVTTDAVQVLGGYGYIKEYPVEKMMRDAKITQIYEGTNQIQRVVLAQEILKKGCEIKDMY